MLGTIVNVSAIAIGSSAGALLNKGIKDEYKSTITQALGLVAVSLGITWIVTNISKSTEPLLFIISLVLGSFIGVLIDIEGKVNALGERFKKKDDKNSLMEGLITAILLFCVGTMSILGPLESALKGDNTLLFTNALLDGVTSLILASTFGFGIIISGVVLFIWQGTIFISAQAISPFITPMILSELSIIGGILILSTGINILEIKKIKTLNMLPSLAIPFIYSLIMTVIN